MQIASEYNHKGVYDKPTSNVFLNLYTVYVFVTFTMVKCPKDGRIINVKRAFG